LRSLARSLARYGSLITRGEDATIVYDVKRRVGAPQLKKGKLTLIDHEAVWDAEIGQEREMDEEELEEAVTNPRHHCSATPGFGVEARVPEHVFEQKSKVKLVLSPTQLTLRPLTLTEELRENHDDHIDVLRKPLIGKDGEVYVIPKNHVPRKKISFEEQAEIEEQKREERVRLDAKMKKKKAMMEQGGGG
jgi:hypothetical protein